MSQLTLINATDLNLWANRNTASMTLPQLLRRLITTTAKRLNLISFRAGDGTAIGGWDGRLETLESTAFVPEGKSVWELGTSQGIKGKADEDYEKRKANTLGYLPSETTFVFITPRRWGGKDTWIAERNAEGFWKEVRAYDADDLETWLELSPSVHIWLSVLLGKRPESAVDIGNFWDEWSSVTNPQLSPDLIISGRNEITQQIYDWLQNPASTLALKADSKDEAVAFFAGSLNLLPDDEREYYSARCVVVESLTAWRKLAASEAPSVLIPIFEDRGNISNASRQGHHVLIPLGRADASSPQTMLITRLHRGAAENELLKLGLPKDKADSLATLARRSLLALRRKLAVAPEIQCPAWASPINAKEILPLLLAGKWIDSNPADQEIIAKLAGTGYEEVNKILARWSNEPDSPIRRIGNTWFLVSKEDAWDLIAKFLTREDLNKIEETFLQVFSIEDSNLELSGSERWKANLLDNSISHSNNLREGLAETLSIMAARSEATLWLDATSGQERANKILSVLFKDANKNWKFWSSIASQLQLLAEASPEMFLEAVEQGLTDDKPILKLFSESDHNNFFVGGSQHPHLLWSLELVAWHPDHLSRAALLLAKLTRLDPGGKLANRPESSLRGIFLGWYPQTNANLEKRLKVIDLIRRREPETAWKLMRDLLPTQHSTGHPTAKPQWREWNVNSEPKVTYAEIWQLTKEIISRMLEDVGLTGSRWKSLLGALGQLPKEQHDAILEKLKRIDSNQFAPKDRIAIWEKLRSIISRHREYPDAQWAMPSEIIDNLETAYNRFTPESLSDQYSWLFSHQVKLINPLTRNPEDWHLKEELIDELRVKSAKDIFSKAGVSGILETAQKSAEPYILGTILGRAALIEAEEDELIDNYLSSSEVKLYSLVFGYTFGRFQDKGLSWVKEKFQKNSAEWTPEQKANFLLPLPFVSEIWDVAESDSTPETKSSYWTRVNPRYAKDSDFERAVKELVEHKRPHFAVDFLALYAHGEAVKIPVTLVADLLESLIKITADSEIQWGSIGYDLSILMGIIRNSGEIDESRIAALEWYFFPLLENYGENPIILHRELSHNPVFFVELMKIIFKSKNEETDEQISGSEERALQAYRLINSWHLCPGQNNDGSLDGEILQNWITKACEELHKSGRETIGDQQIGQALAESPPGSDGAFPHEYVREIIDGLSNIEIERGFEIRIFNNRGVTSRGLTDGGSQERDLAQIYLDYAAKVNDKHPRTAAMLRRIAEGYLEQARREDTSAELTEDFWR